MILQALEIVLAGGHLSRDEARATMHGLLEPGLPTERIGALLAALRLRGETVDEVVGFVEALRERAVASARPRPECIDVCGTGGDGLGTFNVSTTVAFVVAAAGQPIAKHGNRAVSSKCGSFDVLDALGVAYASDPAGVDAQIDRFGLGFMFAPAFHPTLKALGQVRRNLGFYTVFNMLGPLLNPVGAKRQLIGVFRDSALGLVADALVELGSDHAWVVRGQDGLDELSVTGPTTVVRALKAGVVRDTVHPEDAGFERSPVESLRGGDAKDNAGILVRVLEGTTGGPRDVVLLNAAAALQVAGRASDFASAVAMAREAIDSGRARDLLKRMQAAR